jgi:hypothetical protein
MLLIGFAAIGIAGYRRSARDHLCGRHERWERSETHRGARASKVDLLGNRFCLDYVDQAISWDTRQINHAQPRARPHAEFGYAIAKVRTAPDKPAPAAEGRGKMAALCFALECNEHPKQQE